MHLEDQMEIGEKKMTQDQERYHYFTMADSNKVFCIFNFLIKIFLGWFH